MKGLTRFVIVLAVALLAVSGCAGTAVVEKEPLTFQSPAEGELTPWTDKPFANARENFQFAIVSDRTGGHRPGVFGRAVQKLNLLQPEFVICVGDLIEGYTEDVTTLDAQRDELDALVDGLEMPFFRVAGNHDVSNPFMIEHYKERYGRTYYSFTYGDVLFLCLCTEDPTHMVLGEDQIEYMKKALDENEDVRWTFVFMHVPLWDAPDPYVEKSDWPRMEALLKDRKHTVFAGHYHVYTKHTRNDADYFVLSTTGGARGRTEIGLGELDHIVWVTMSDEGPKIANVVLDGILSKDFVTKESRSLVESFLLGNVVEVEPVFTDKDSFTSATVSLTLNNNSDVPAKYGVSLTGTSRLAVQPPRLEMTLAPHSSKRFPLKLTGNEETPPEELPLEELPPVVVEWVVAFTPPGLDLIESTGSRKVGVEKVRFIDGEYVDDFKAYEDDTDGTPAWLPVVGDWKMRDGEYHQVQTQGYDRFSTADVCVKGDYRIETKVRVIEGAFDPGFMFNMSSRKWTSSTQMIRFATYKTVWCGNFSPKGTYAMEHSAPSGLDDAEGWVTVAVNVRNSAGTYDVEVNGKTVAQDQKLTYVSGEESGRCVALVSCNGHVAFDYLKVTPLAAGKHTTRPGGRFEGI